MNKKLFAIIAFFCFTALSFIACSDDDEVEIDQEWVALNDKQVTDVAANSDFTAIKSYSENGSVYYRKIDFLEETPTPTQKSSLTPKISPDGKPYFTDSIAIRYEGRFYLKDGTPHIFDSTEGENGNARIYRTRVNKFIDGFSTMLQQMKLSDGMDEVEVCIPYKLGYNATAQYSNNVMTIPAYTTLWFKIKLIAIYPDNPGEFD